MHLYEEYGEDCVKWLRGMFGFALWDRQRRSLLLARDRLGIKPLCYALTDDSIVFGSELKSVIMSGEVHTVLDVRALDDLLDIGFVTGTKTLCRAIRRLEPGHRLLYRDGRSVIERYWNLDFPSPGAAERARSADDWAEEFGAKLSESVRLHLRGDVEIGAWLSGGIDSSAVASLMRRTSPLPVRTFTLAFEDPAMDEVRDNETLSDHDTRSFRNRRTLCTASDFERLPQAIWHCEDPFAFGLEIPRLVLSELAAAEVKVVLSGEGADEMLGGYHWLERYWRLRHLMRLPRPLRSALGSTLAATNRRWRASARMLAAPSGMNPVSYRHFIHANARRGGWLLSDETRAALAAAGSGPDLPALPQGFERWGRFSQLQYLETSTRLPDFITRHVDSASMAHSLEVRVPFLDHELVELCARIPPSLGFHGGVGKQVLLRAMREKLPPTFLQRRKHGLGAPCAAWLRDPPAFALELLSEKALQRTGYFDPARVRRALARHRGGEEGFFDSLMVVLGVQIWDGLFLRDFPDGGRRRA